VVDSQGNVIIATNFTEQWGGSCHIFNDCPTTTQANIAKYAPNGSSLWGAFGNQVLGMAADSSGNLFTADSSNISIYQTGSSVTPTQQTVVVPQPIIFSSVVLHITSDDRLIECGTATAAPSGVPGIPNRPTPTCIAFDSNLNVLWTGTIGGSQGETLSDFALDASNNLYITGQTKSEPKNSSITPFTALIPFPVTPGAFGAVKGATAVFVAKFDPTGKLVYSSAFGSSGDNYSTGLQVDSAGSVYLTVNSSKPDFPTPGAIALPANSPWLALKLNPNGSEISWVAPMTSALNSLQLPAVDPQGNFYAVGGVTSSASFTPTNQTVSVCGNQNGSAASILFELDPNGNLVMSTFVPGALPLLDQGGLILSERNESPFSLFNKGSLAGPGIFCVVNAANTDEEGLLPGEVIAIHGIGFGPSQPQAAVPANGFYPTSLGGVSVQIGGYPAPLIYASDSQINAVVPFEVAESNTIGVQVTGAGSILYDSGYPQPVYFTYGNLAGAQAIAINQDGSLNSASSAAPKGSVLTLFGTGFTFPTPYPQDGAVGTGQLTLPLTLQSYNTIDVLNLTTYLGEFPIVSITDTAGQIEGLSEVRIQIPASFPADGQVFLWGSNGAYVFIQ
jgi:uncharacterized protein (TIGR03437 family)